MLLTPPQNHWWHVPLYVNTSGLSTSSIPYDNDRFEINFDFIHHQLTIETSRGKKHSFRLHDGLSVSEFYHKLKQILNSLGIDAPIKAKPYDLDTDLPFAEDTTHHAYDEESVERYWQILMQVDRIFKIFNRNFCGKVCPIQLYWHSFDLAVTRFSGEKAPPVPDMEPVDREAYSHEVISFGFWPGDNNMREPAFYSYTYPAPENIDQINLAPKEAYWTKQNGSPLALLMYDNARNSADPEKTILQFLESAYQAGIETANWKTQTIHR